MDNDQPAGAPGDKRVLIVDDEADLREMVAFAFDLEGFQTQTAANGRQAFAIIKEQPVDIVISDVRMPEGDGIELIGNIKIVNPRLPLVILTTGFSDLRLEDAYDHGAEALFVKPFALHELISCVKHLLSYADGRFSGRRDIRVSFQLPVALAAADRPAAFTGHTTNLSKGGVFVVLAGGYPETGTRVTVRLDDGAGNDGPMALAGVVAWVKRDPAAVPAGCGVVFHEPSGHAKSRYFELLNGIKTTRVKK